MLSYKQTLHVPTAAELPGSADDGQIAFIADSQTSQTYSAASNSWVPLGRQMVFKSSVVINGKNTGSTVVYTLPSSPLYFYPTGIILRPVSVTGGGTAPVMTIGTNATNYNNIATSSLVNSILGLLDVNNGVPIMATFSPALTGGTGVRVNVTVGSILYTTYSFKVDLLGFYDSTTP